jgi:MoaD family protein
MPVKVRVPTPLQKLTNNQKEVEAQGNNITAVFDHLEKNYPGIKERLYDEDGTLRRFINVYVNEEDIRFLDGVNTAIKEGDDISIVPAIAGGSGIPR